jgi:hypothetical protein
LDDTGHVLGDGRKGEGEGGGGGRHLLGSEILSSKFTNLQITALRDSLRYTRYRQRVIIIYIYILFD